MKKKYLFGRQGIDEYQEELQKELAFLNLNRARTFIFIVVVIELLLLLVDVYVFRRMDHMPSSQTYSVFMFLGLLLVSLFFLFIFTHLQKLMQDQRIKPGAVKTVLLAYLTLVMTWGALQSTYIQQLNGSLAAFVVVLMLGSLLLYLDSCSLIVPYLSAVLAFMLSAPDSFAFFEQGLKHYLSLGIFMVLSWLSSRSLYNNFTNEFIARCLIEVQNRLLKEANRELLDEIVARKEVQDRLELVNQELVSLSLMDELTGIPNRRNLDFFLNYEWQRGKREGTSITLIMIDIDSFKAFNDQYGHVRGDQVLTQVASSLNDSRRRSTDFVGRYGGEEFLFIAMNIGKDGARTLAEIIRQHVESLTIPHSNSNVAPWLTVSLGAATLVPGEVETINEAINMADTALYVAKKRGGNQFVVYRSPQESLFPITT